MKIAPGKKGEEPGAIWPGAGDNPAYFLKMSVLVIFMNLKALPGSL
jgi:hypothetical protein